MPVKFDFAGIFSPKKTKEEKKDELLDSLIDDLTEVTIQTEGLIPGQTPLRIQWKEGKPLYKETVQGIELDWEAHKNAPLDRRNFYFVHSTFIWLCRQHVFGVPQ